MRTFIDQYNRVHRAKTVRELCSNLGRTSAAKMYQDTKQGAVHVGYVIGGLWLTEYVPVRK